MVFGGRLEPINGPAMKEIRCPIYGFISLDDWEIDIISQPAFQRLRRIRQLAWTDLVYPGAMHTRFEHSLGVMNMADMLYACVAERSIEILRSSFGYNKDGLQRHRKLIRLAALLHDVGHGPFSHAAEGLMPPRADGSGKLHKHEEYSIGIIKNKFQDVIENHNANVNYGFTIDDVVGLIRGKDFAGRASIWQEIIAGQLDADRMDYLLRDSYHAGVEYGTYDWRRLALSVQLVPDIESGEPRFGISDGGKHVAESLIIARYMMFNQVYFHKTRVILDFHLAEAMKQLLPGGTFPPPTNEGVEEYLSWDDWRILGEFSRGLGGEHARRLMERDFYRLAWETPEFPIQDDLNRLTSAEEAIGDLAPVRRAAEKSWYRIGSEDLPVAARHPSGRTVNLSMCSTIVKDMTPSRCIRLYVPVERMNGAKSRLDKV